MTDAEAKRERLRILHWLEQLAAGVAGGDRQAFEEARTVLARIALQGSPELVAHVLRGLVLARDEQQPEWENLFD